MSARQHLTQLCDRYGVPLDRGERMLPLVERALRAPDGLRERILGLVEGSLERESKRLDGAERLRAVDERTLRVVARLVHGWKAPDWLEQHESDLSDAHRDELGGTGSD